MEIKFILLLLIIAAPLRAGDSAKSKPKMRTLKELIALADEKGKIGSFPIIVGKDIGFQADMPNKSISYATERIRDGYGLDFILIYNTVPTKGVRPIGFVIGTYKTESDTDGWTFRASLSGVLQKAAHAAGGDGGVTQTPVPLNTITRKRFTKEIDFLLNEAASLEFNLETSDK